MKPPPFLGKHALVKRLSHQVGSKSMAIALLKKRGHMTASGKLTAEGRKRDAMTAKERAVDRATDGKGTPRDYAFNKFANTVRRRKLHK